jgi:hypothetical protein
MKYKLEELLSRNNFIGQCFTSCVTEYIAKEITSKEGYSLENEEIDISLTINGTECDFGKFLKLLEDNYHSVCRNKAKRMVAKKMSAKASEMIDTLQTLQSKLEHLESTVHWDDTLNE